MGNSLLDVCVFGRRAGAAAAAWAGSTHPGMPTLVHLDEWKHFRQEAGLSNGLPSPIILPDYTRKSAVTLLDHPAIAGQVDEHIHAT
jgi:hypothetical protein